MDEEAQDELRRYALRWHRIDPLLEEQREEDVRRSDTASNIAAFARLWRAVVRQNPPEPSSGLVEQQRIFTKLGRS